MQQITKFIECLLPITICNLKCHYCYVIQRNNRLMKNAVFDFSISKMLSALSKERMGGICYFSICGAGETMLCKELPELVRGLLDEGHFVNITTNGTCTGCIRRLLNVLDVENAKRLHFSFSYHYLELKRLRLNDIFFSNIELVRNKGCSFIVQVNLCDEYIPVKEEIIAEVQSHTGGIPQLAATRKENDLKNDIQLYTDLTPEAYLEEGKAFKSPLFNFTMQNFNKKRTEYCYAGKWSYVLNLQTGILQACYASNQRINIFADVTKKIDFATIGKHCPSGWCMNSSHFLAWGVIPSIVTPSYGELRDRLNCHWLNQTTSIAFSHKLSEVNSHDTWLQRLRSEWSFHKNRLLFGVYAIIPDYIKQLIRKIYAVK